MSSLKLRPDNSDNCLIFRETAGPPVFMIPRRLTSSRNPALHDEDLPLNSNLKYHSCHSNHSLNMCCTPHELAPNAKIREPRVTLGLLKEAWNQKLRRQPKGQRARGKEQGVRSKARGKGKVARHIAH